ncbi:hypothetical protein [Hyphobacterium sp.]|uniref:hypothetical protein n=1 Tax=Hyphobacterium sp. TaxID=2004662 RepID=UPI003B515E41
MTIRPPKKTETLEVRVPETLKSEFLDACRRKGLSASEAVRDFMTAQTGRSQSFSLVSKGMAIMTNPTFSIPALLSIPVFAAAFLSWTPAVGADDVELMFEVSIQNASSEQAVNGILNLDYDAPAIYRLSPAADEAGAYYYDVSVSAHPCTDDGEIRCASENVMIHVEIVRHDDSGPQVIASPRLLARYEGRAAMRVEPVDGFRISIEVFASYPEGRES